ncbi:MAG: hypothetical protein QXH37_02120 [Candidatus Bathyarchaeia archaeon]
MEKWAQFRKEVDAIFERSWRELVDEYRQKRMLPFLCSEADVKMHLAHKLLGKYPCEWVHRELPIPIDVKRFSEDLGRLGTIKRGNCIVADICIIDHEKLLPLMIAEVKFSPWPIGFLPILGALEAKDDGRKKKYVEIVKKALKNNIDKLQLQQEFGPSTEMFEKAFLGRRRKGESTQVEKLIKVLKNFERRRVIVSAYWCIIDEVYLNLEERLNV